MRILYIIHGWTYDIRPWEEVAGYLDEMGQKTMLLRVPGLTAPSDKVWTIKDYVEWADRNIPDNAIVLGHSNGGRILLNLASEKPWKFKKMILLDSAGIYEQSLKVKIVRSASKMFSVFGKVELFRKIVYRIMGANDYNQAPPNMKKTLDNMIQSDKQLDLSKITTPTEIIWGDEDKITPLHQGKTIHRELPNSTLKVVKGWSHSPYLRHPKELAKEIMKAVGDTK